MIHVTTDLKEGIFSRMIVLLCGYYPSPGPSRQQLEELLIQGGAVVCSTLADFYKKCFQKPLHLAPPFKYKVMKSIDIYILIFRF